MALTLGLDSEAVVTALEAQRLVGIALGRVVAHEVVHVLAPVVRHGGTSVMRPRMHAFQLTGGRPAPEGDCADALAAGARAWLATGGFPRTADWRGPGAPGSAPIDASLAAR